MKHDRIRNKIISAIFKAWSHVVHQTLTQRGAKLGNIIIDGSGLVIYSMHSLHMLSFVSYASPMTKLNILQHTRVYIEIGEAS